MIHLDQAVDCLVDVPRVVDDWRAVAAAMQRASRRSFAAVEQRRRAGDSEVEEKSEQGQSGVCQINENPWKGHRQ